MCDILLYVMRHVLLEAMSDTVVRWKETGDEARRLGLRYKNFNFRVL